MPRLFRALHLTSLASAAILTCIVLSSFSIASHAGHIGGALVGVAHGATLEAPASTPTPDALPWIAYVGFALAAGGGLLKILDVLIAGLKWLAPRTETTLDDIAGRDLELVHDKLDAVLQVVTRFIPATGVPTASSLVTTAPAKTPQGGFTTVRVMLTLACFVPGAIFAIIAGCATLKTEVKSTEAGVVTCAKADKPAVQAFALQLTMNAVADLTRGVSMDDMWDHLKVDAEVAGKTQGIDVAACAFGGLLADLERLFHPATPGTATSALSSDAFGDGDPLAPGRAAFTSFTTAHGITRVDQ